MSENLRLVSDLALILISAGVVTIIFKLLKQPLVLGYLVAGFLVGPHLNIFPTVTDVADVEVWSEIGIIFMMFGLGLEFSFRKLFSVGSKAFVTAFVGILGMMGVGVLLGLIMDWDIMQSIFLGGMLSMSSTAIIIKAFDDLKLKGESFADLTMVVLIIQDIVAVVMMVLMSTVAASKNASPGKEMVMSIVKLVFFLILWFVIGIYVIPSFFRAAKKYINDENLLIISIGLCFGMVIIANKVGFSSALGAFVIGSILSETVESHRIEELTKSIKDLFSAIFFVSVGMMIDPSVLQQYWKLVLSLVLITLIVKAFISTLSAVLAGANLEDSVKTGFTLSQIGEFAFIIASVGVAQGVMPSYIYPVIIAASVITTFTTPYWIRAGKPMYEFLDRKMSPSLKSRLDEYSLLGNESGKKDWKSIISSTLPRVLIFSVVSVALLFVIFNYLVPFVGKIELLQKIPKWWYNLLFAAGVLLVMTPFLYGIVYNNQKTRELYMELVKLNKGNVVVITVWTILRFIIAGFFVFSILVKFFSYTKWVIILITLLVIVFMVFSNNTLRRFSFIESAFMKNLKAKDQFQKS
ncbi:MAG: cation:proton antiporter [Bacteroidales bacterium]|nr:cation:proton antiporter [Bacteroidales bacterium]